MRPLPVLTLTTFVDCFRNCDPPTNPLPFLHHPLFSLFFGTHLVFVIVWHLHRFLQHADTHVQWWSRNKRAHGNGLNGAGGASGAAGGAGGNVHHHNGSSSNINNNHLRRSNIYTAHPADSIRGLQPLPVVLPLPLSLPHPPSGGASPASSSTTPPATQQQQHQPLQQQQYFHPYQQQQHVHHSHTHHHHTHHHVPLYPHDCDDDAAYEEPEYHQPQQLHSVNSSSSLSSMGSSSLPQEASNSRANHWPPGATSATMVIAS